MITAENSYYTRYSNSSRATNDKTSIHDVASRTAFRNVMPKFNFA